MCAEVLDGCNIRSVVELEVTEILLVVNVKLVVDPITIVDEVPDTVKVPVLGT